MNRLPLMVAAAGAAIAIAACGSADPGTGGASLPAPSGPAARGAAGQLVQIHGSTLILSNANGDTTVTFSASTTITRTSTGTVADIVPGVCITATGTKDATGAVTAAVVSVTNPVNGSCRSGFGVGGARRSPNPSFSFSPNPANANRAIVRGKVTAVNGTSVTVLESSGSSVTFAIPTTVRVATSSAGTDADLSDGECVAAFGSRDATGTVAARSLTIVPAGPSGCFTGGGFGGGGFGGGGFGGGGFGGGGGGGSTAAA